LPSITDSKRQKRLLPGHGGAIRPPLIEGVNVDRVVYVSDAECIVGCRLLVEKEGILVGASSGGAPIAVARLCNDIPSGATSVVIFPDRGDPQLQQDVGSSIDGRVDLLVS
jgi:cysteine synthase